MRIAILMLLLALMSCNVVADDSRFAKLIDDCYKLIDDNKISELKRVIDENPNVIFPTKVSAISLLYHAFSEKNNEAAKLLIEKGALQLEHKHGNNPLCFAAMYGDVEIVKFVLSKSDEKYVNTMYLGLYPLHYAVLNNPKIVDLLIKSGARLGVKGVRGNTPLHYLVRLSPHGGSWAEKDKKSTSLILNAAKDKKKLISIENNAGYNVFHCACQYSGNNFDFVKYCIDNKLVDINTASSKSGKTALHIACYNGYTKIVDLLLANNAKVNIKSLDGRTPLHATCAWGYGNKEIIETLIKNGVEINAVDKKGKTALDYAIWQKKDDWAQILREHGAKTAKELNNPSSPNKN